MTKYHETIEKTRTRYELNILLAIVTTGVVTSSIFYKSLAGDHIWKNGTLEMSFLGSRALFNFTMSANQWFLFTAGLSIPLVIICFVKTAKYWEEHVVV